MLKIQEKIYRCYPLETSNKNVPNGAFLLAQYNEGETTYTAYIEKSGYMFLVGDWVEDKPIPITMSKAGRITGDSESIIEFMYKSYFVLE
jgi:hypothetical protein